MSHKQSQPHTKFLLSSACVAACAIFLLDLVIQLGVAMGVFYVVVVWLAYFTRVQRVIYGAAIACSLLTMAGWASSPEGGEFWHVLLNRILALFVIWLAAVLLGRARGLLDELEDRARKARGDAVALRARDEQIRSLLNSTAEGIYGLDLDGNCTFANAACAQLLGYDSPEEFLGRNMHELIHHTRENGDAYPNHECRIYQAFRDGTAAHVDDEVLWKKDGNSFSAEYWSYPVHRDGKLTGSVVTFLDITQRKQLEQEQQRLQRELEYRVEQRTAELAQANRCLEQSNEELQQFAYVASHDLKTPLRAIGGFAQFLQADYAGKLDDDADEYIDRIVAGVERMQKLIDDLLSLSRVESRGTPLETTSLNDVAADAQALLHADIVESNARIAVDELPDVVGDRAQLVQLFQNLVGNGLKYHDGDEPPCVHVSAEVDGDECTIAVRDNGIGIAPEHHQRIFEIFKRLHTSSEYSGTGIGLAVCRRIVLRHGGRIWLESTPGSGSTFYFTLKIAATEESDPTTQLAMAH